MENGYASPRLATRHGHSPRSPPRSPVTPVSSSQRVNGQERSRTMPGATPFQEYPPAQPFINDDYRRDVTKPQTAYPESNRQAVMSALKSLQEKIRSLESERTVAEENLCTLATETSRYQDIMQSEPDLSQSRVSQMSGQPANMSQQANDIHGKLEVAEHRCELLEKQLDYMRRMVHSAENERNKATRRMTTLEQQRQELERDEQLNKMNKVAKLERDHLKLTATQTLAENKIRDLEEKLRLERKYRKSFQEKTAEWETAAETDRILREATGTDHPSQKPKKKKKKKKVVVPSDHHPQVSAGNRKYPDRRKPGREPPEHYKLNLGEIPFIAGKSTAPSHSLAANFQEVLSLMKTHNPKLCRSPRNHLRSGYKYLPTYGSTGSNTGSSSGSRSGSRPESDLTDLMLQLQDEFGHLSFEHQELSRQLQEAIDPGLREDLERELDHVVARMETKGEQIARLRKHQEKTSRGRSKKRSQPLTSQRPHSAMAALPDSVSGEVEVTTTIRTKGKGHGPVVLSPTSGNRAQASLNLFKDLKKIQTSLKKDDISWDC